MKMRLLSHGFKAIRILYVARNMLFLAERPSYRDVNSRYWAFGYEADTLHKKEILWHRQHCNVFLYANK
jgi:hypothetical protein